MGMWVKASLSSAMIIELNRDCLCPIMHDFPCFCMMLCARPVLRGDGIPGSWGSSFIKVKMDKFESALC